MPCLEIRAQEMFFLGMRSFLSELLEVLPDEDESEKRNTFTEKSGMWRFISRWNSKSGNIQILREREVVWVMRLEGFGHTRMIPVLIAALSGRYEAAEFCGGRGPQEFQLPGDSIRYENAWSGDFKRFQGVERILSYQGGSASRLDRQTYWGGMLVD